MTKRILIILLALTPLAGWAIDIGSIFGPQKYKMYGCSGGLKTNLSPQQDCQRVQEGTVVFKIVKDKSEVYGSYTLIDGTKHLIPFEDCKVIDEKNWTCGGKETNASGPNWSSFFRTYKYQMIDGEVNVSDFYSREYFNGQQTKSEYTVGPKFVKQ